MNNDILYKYRTWNNLFNRKVLTDNELYLSSPADFNDPFDCQVMMNFNLLENRVEIDKYFEQAVDNHWETLSKQGKSKLKIKELLIDDYLNNPTEFQNGFESYSSSKQNSKFGILSLSQRWDSILMWSHYSAEHTGYSVGFDLNKLSETNHFDTGREVIYSNNNEFPKLNPIDNESYDIFKTTHYKAKDWEYEMEYRLLKVFENKETSNINRVIKIPNECFVEIILGMKISENNKLEIINIAKCKGIRVYQASRVPKRFQLTRIRII
jgi:hypothetical protein